MRNTEPKSLKDVLELMLKTYRLKGRLQQERIAALWEQQMGASVHRHTREIKVVHKKLFVTIDSPALKQELFFGREKIREIFNEALGENYLEEVIIR